MTRKAYLVTLPNWSNLCMVVPAETPGKAKAVSHAYARIAGYDLPFIAFRAKRVPKFDSLAHEMEGKYPWCLGWKEGSESWGCLSQ